jgi:ureidoglycolate lyase
MECHPWSAQSFIALREVPYLVVVALPGDDGLPDLQTLKAFVCEDGMGVSYRSSVWHFAFTSLRDVNEVVVIMSSTGRDDGTVIARLGQPVTVNLPAGELG